MIDLRSDTVTRPSAGMRKAMAEAEVGDDVYGDDPTVHALEAEVAALLGKEAALYVPSGSMGNQLAIATQTRPGEEVIVGEGAHVAWNEAAAGSALSGVQLAVAGRGGFFSADEMEAEIKTGSYYNPRAALVCVENTHNRAGGRVFPQRTVLEVVERARARGLSTHLDGARIWNASVATGLREAELAAPFDTVSVCFSKGLGAPIGSAFCGPRKLVVEARKFRKRWGAGMRQVGVIAAAARYALAHNRARLAEDHANARLFASRLTGARGVRVESQQVETNMVLVHLEPHLEPGRVVAVARELGLAIDPSGPHRLRAVTHLDASRTEVEKAADILARAVLEELSASGDHPLAASRKADG